MKIIVFDYNRFTNTKTSPALSAEGIEHIVLCHAPEARRKFIDSGLINPDYIIATNEPPGLAYQRNFALEMLDENEWAIFFSDDYLQMYRLSEYITYKDIGEIPITTKNTTEWGKKFNNKITLKQFIGNAKESMCMANEFGVYLCGFAAYANPLFRKNLWKFGAFCDGRAICVKKSKLRYDINIQTMDDYFWTALNLKTFGNTLINNWILPEFERYAPGGIGTLEQRMPQKIKEAAYMVKMFPGIVHYSEKKNQPNNSHVKISTGGRSTKVKL